MLTRCQPIATVRLEWHVCYRAGCGKKIAQVRYELAPRRL